ncbi:Thiazole synthase [Serratia fonticola]|uniref:thiazole synthase n=1 Tax=Serratia fonticola TaxID=47917 RepID=A0A4U9WLU9_SERFO|nr:Thiazole synthase [Serratia fonticola]
MLQIADTTFTSRLFTGTGKFATPELMLAALQASGSQLVTMAMKRVDLRGGNDAILAPLQRLAVKLLPNTSGAKRQMRRYLPPGWRAKRWGLTGSNWKFTQR